MLVYLQEDVVTEESELMDLMNLEPEGFLAQRGNAEFAALNLSGSTSNSLSHPLSLI